MSRRAFPGLLALTLLGLASACTLPGGVSSSGGNSPEVVRRAAAGKVIAVSLAGSVVVPAGLIANNGGNLIANNSAGVVGKPYRALALDEQAAAGLEVFLADAKGAAIPNLASVRTDARGHYSFPRVPTGFTLRVVVRLKGADGEAPLLQTLAKSGRAGSADVSVATTFAAAALTQDHASALGDFDPGAFSRVVAATASQLGAADLAALTDRAAMAERVRQLAAENAELRATVAGLQKQLEDLKGAKTGEDLAAQAATLDKPAAGASAQPTASPAAQASPTPHAEPTRAASAAPTANPRPSATQDAAEPTARGWHVSPYLRDPAPFHEAAGGLAVAGDGTLYAADTMGHTIYKVAVDGSATVLAGGTPGFADGQGAAAQFNEPWGLVLDGSGNLYVADHSNHAIRKVTPDGAVTTVAGSGVAGYRNELGKAAQFNEPKGLAGDAAGNLYVADSHNNRIRKIAPDGRVSTLAGATTGGWADGSGEAVRFAGPVDLALDSKGALWVTDGNNDRLRRIGPDGQVSSPVGSGTKGFADGTGAAASFSFPSGLVIDAQDNLYVADLTNHRIRLVQPDL